MDLGDYARAEQPGGWGEGGGCLYRITDRVEALFEALILLATYIVDKTTLIGTVARERSGELRKYLQLVAKGDKGVSREAQDDSKGPRFLELFRKAV